MKNELTQIVVILDRSGSMLDCKKQTINNFNEFLSEQKRQPGEARLRLVQFDDQYEFLYDKPLQAAEPLTDTTFVPRGSTALNDAIGRTCDELGHELRHMAEIDRPGKVVVIVLTDGYENASKTYSQHKVKQIVGHQRSKYNWAFIFMGAEERAVMQAEQYNIPAANAMYTSTFDPCAYMSAGTTMSNSVSAYRSSGYLRAFTQQERDEAAGVVTGIVTPTVPTPTVTIGPDDNETPTADAKEAA